MPFIPHTSEDVKQMLAEIEAPSIEALFDEIPKNLQKELSNTIPEGLSELEVSQLMQQYAKRDIADLCFIGAGAYEHYIPAAVWEIASRGEFMTAYTPYQAEASQGTLQLLYEYQSMMASLTKLDVSNASMYDGASALAEAVLMAVRANKQAKSRRILIPKTLHPYYRAVVQAIVMPQQLDLVEIDYSPETGCTLQSALDGFSGQDIVAVVIPQPNFFGVLEEVDTLTNWAHDNAAFAIAVVNPLSLALFKAPGDWGRKGVDIACGEAQPFGVPLASGGPYVGFMCCKQEHVRQMPGRIVGKTVDLEGKRGFALTLQAREQHIRRSKATSNICTNQGLLVTAVTIYLSLLGAEGLREVAVKCHDNTRKLAAKLKEISGIEQVFNSPYFHEVLFRFIPAKAGTQQNKHKKAQDILDALSKIGIEGGFATSKNYPELGECLLVCATETKSDADLERFAEALKKVL